MIFLVSEKAYVGEATNSILSFRLAARALYPVLEPEIALVQIARYTEQQADSLRTLENDLAATLSESFGGAVQEHLAPLIEQIHETVSRATDATAQVQIEGVQKIIDGFMTGMNEQLGSNFQQLGSSIEQASTNLGDLTERLEIATASQAQIMERTTQTAEVLERQLPALLSFGEKLDHAANRFNEAIENIAALSKLQVHVHGRLREDKRIPALRNFWHWFLAQKKSNPEDVKTMRHFVEDCLREIVGKDQIDLMVRRFFRAP